MPQLSTAEQHCPLKLAPTAHGAERMPFEAHAQEAHTQEFLTSKPCSLNQKALPVPSAALPPLL